MPIITFTPSEEKLLAPLRRLEPYDRLIKWIKERHAIHTKRFPDGYHAPLHNKDGQPLPDTSPKETQPPWTSDPVLQRVFFCNPYRENDKVTSYLRDTFREEYWDDKCVLLGTILLRWYNYIPTMARLVANKIPQGLGGSLTQCNKLLDQARKMLVNLRDDHDGQLFGGAYIIRPVVDGPDGEGVRKVEAITDLMKRMACDPALYADLCGDKPVKGSVTITGCERGSMEYAFHRLTAFKGMGPFYVYQFIADLAYTHVLRNAPDWFTWSFCGPGTARGLVRLQYPTGEAPELPRQFKAPPGAMEQLLKLQGQVNKSLKLSVPTGKVLRKGTPCPEVKELTKGGEVRKLQYIHMRDLTNCLCEYDKYERALFNERNIKRPYGGRG